MDIAAKNMAGGEDGDWSLKGPTRGRRAMSTPTPESFAQRTLRAPAESQTRPTRAPASPRSWWEESDHALAAWDGPGTQVASTPSSPPDTRSGGKWGGANDRCVILPECGVGRCVETDGVLGSRIRIDLDTSDVIEGSATARMLAGDHAISDDAHGRTPSAPSISLCSVRSPWVRVLPRDDNSPSSVRIRRIGGVIIMCVRVLGGWVGGGGGGGGGGEGCGVVWRGEVNGENGEGDEF